MFFPVVSQITVFWDVTPYSFDVLLTVHLSIFILVIIQLDAQNLFNNKFISCLYVSSTTCSSSGGQNCIIQLLVSLHLASGIITPIGVMIPEAV